MSDEMCLFCSKAQCFNKLSAMPDTKVKTPPRLPLGRLIQTMKNVFPTLTIAPQRFPDMLVTGLPGIRTVYMVNNPDMAQYVLQKNYRNFPKAKGLVKK